LDDRDLFVVRQRRALGHRSPRSDDRCATPSIHANGPERLEIDTDRRHPAKANEGDGPCFVCCAGVRWRTKRRMRDIEVASEARNLRFPMGPRLKRLSCKGSPKTPRKKSAQRHARYSPRTVKGSDFSGRAMGISRLTFGQRFPKRIKIDEPQLSSARHGAGGLQHLA
jgi:hypothetical protein